jgi:hypothetical protein
MRVASAWQTWLPDGQGLDATPARRDSGRRGCAGYSGLATPLTQGVCAKIHIRNAEPVALTASDLAVGPPASSSSMNRVSAFR